MGQVKIGSKSVQLNSNISVITLNVNTLNIPIEGQRLCRWIKENNLFASLKENS